METVFGLIGLVLFIVSVIALAAGITWSVVKLTPRRNQKPAKAS